MRRAWALLAFLLPLAGCVGLSAEAPAETAAAAAGDEVAAAPVAPSAEAPAAPAPLPPAPAVEPTPTLFGPGAEPLLRPGDRVALRGACPDACPPSLLRVEPGEASMLEVRVAWNGTRTRGVSLQLVAPEGAVLPGERGFDAARVLVPDAAAGTYVVRLEGEGDVSGWAALRERGAQRGEGSDRSPNLVTLVPAPVAMGSCDPWERVEQEAKRCLRLGNGIGNVGDGPLEVALALQEGPGALAGQARFVQRVYQAAGAPREVPVGPAVFHRTHAHFHYDGLARFSLHPVDPATGLRAEAVATHHKAGFCLLDIGEMEEPDAEPETRREERAEQDCLVPRTTGWSMGVSRGFYDYYGAGLTDQYVEVTGVPEGLYELVSDCNWSGSLHELDLSDNAASVLVRLQGGKVEVVEERGFYRLPDA